MGMDGLRCYTSRGNCHFYTTEIKLYTIRVVSRECRSGPTILVQQKPCLQHAGGVQSLEAANGFVCFELNPNALIVCGV